MGSTVNAAEMALAAEINLDDVLSVYSGRDNACCCGCAGAHRYASAHQAEGAASRGYPLEAADVNDREVARVVRLINENRAAARDTGDHAYVTIGARLYIAYRREGAAAPVAAAKVGA